MHNQIMFALPDTRLAQVIYRRDGVKYSAVIATPSSQDKLQLAMLARRVALSQVIAINPIGK